MFGGVHNKPEAAPPQSFVNPPTVQPGYEPPNVHDGYDAFIREILDDGHSDAFQGPPPEKDEKRESRIHKFLKWSGIAFALAMGGTILKKALTYTGKGAVKAVEVAVKDLPK